MKKTVVTRVYSLADWEDRCEPVQKRLRKFDDANFQARAFDRWRFQVTLDSCSHNAPCYDFGIVASIAGDRRTIEITG